MLRKFALLLLLVVMATPLHARLMYESSLVAIYNVAAEPGARNFHPAIVNPDRLSVLLSQVFVKSPNTQGFVPLFTEKEAAAVAEQLHLSLQNIESDQDLHVVGFRAVGGFFNATRHATSARVFVQNGSLHMIFGQVDGTHNEFRDADKKIPKAGSRRGPLSLGGFLDNGRGVRFAQGRKDWLILDLNMRVEAEVQRKRRLGYDEPAVLPERRSEPQRSEQVAPAAPAQVTPPADDPWRVLKEKLEFLKELKAQGLISNEDYELKKKQILDSL